MLGDLRSHSQSRILAVTVKRLMFLPKLLIIRSLPDYSSLINSSFDPLHAFLHPPSTVSRLEPETPGLREQRCFGDRGRIPARVDSSLGLLFFLRLSCPSRPVLAELVRRHCILSGRVIPNRLALADALERIRPTG